MSTHPLASPATTSPAPARPARRPRSQRLRHLPPLLAAALVASLLAAAPPGAAAVGVAPPAQTDPTSFAAARRVALPDGSTALVRPSGDAAVLGADGSITMRTVRDSRSYGATTTGIAGLTDAELVAELTSAPLRPYAPDQVVVVLADGVDVSPGVSPASAVPAPAHRFTGDDATNTVLAALGTERVERLFAGADDDAWRAARTAAEQTTGSAVLDLTRAYRLTLDAEPLEAAERLRTLPSVTWASPAWAVAGSSTAGVAVPAGTAAASDTAAAAAGSDTGAAAADQPVTGVPSGAATAGDPARRLPPNYGLRSNAQSHWNSPGLNAATAYDHVVDAFDELPGEGEIITTVGVGHLTSDPFGPCGGEVGFFGPTTTVIDGQRYVDMPSMPLIPAFTADPSGALDPLGEVCSDRDPVFSDLGLALSVMSPLPHSRQRPDATGSGLTDLLGLAPGAQHRLVVPASGLPTTVDLAGALLGAAQQDPAPSVITASAHIGGDEVGFPNRYLEDDALLRSVITTIVHGGISVAAAAGDGITTNRYAAFGPSGGGARVDVAPADEATDLADLALSTAPSHIPDSGAIAVGATTLNDVFAEQPHGTDDLSVRSRQTYPAVRWTGSTEFASNYGDRVDVSAPADSIVSLRHRFGGGARDVDVQLGWGTTAAAAQVAAAAAVVRQVARATGAPLDPAGIRALLVDTAATVPGVPQATHPVDVGPQVDLGAAVEELLARADLAPAPGVLRVPVAQRRPVAGDGAVFETWVDDGYLDLAGPPAFPTGEPSGRNNRAWITVAPDWTGLPADATYVLRADGRDAPLLATTKSARLLPEHILGSLGLPLASDEPRTIGLTYLARDGGEVAAEAHVDLTFGPSTGVSAQVHAPLVPGVVRGATIPVEYDLRGVEPVRDDPLLVVSFPGRVKPPVGPPFVPAVTIPLPDLHGTVDVPVADLEGAGVYGVAVHYSDLDLDGFRAPVYSDFGFVRLAPTTDEQPPAPLLRAVRPDPQTAPGHQVEISAGDELEVHWDVGSVPGATSARLEVSAAGPTIAELRNTFSNPEGSQPDDNGVDTGSVALLELGAVAGSAVFSAAELDLYSAMSHGLRLLPTDDAGDVVGLASPVSTVELNGLDPNGLGTVAEGYGVDTRTDQGYVTTLRTDLAVPRGSVQAFDADTLAVTDVPLPRSTVVYRALGAGVFGDHTGLVQELDPFTGEPTAHWSLPDVGSGTASPWSPPRPGRYTLQRAGSDPRDEHGVFLLRDRNDPGSGPYRLVRGDVRDEEFGLIRDVSGPLEALPSAPQPMMVAYDPRGEDVAALGFSPDPFSDPVIELVNPRTADTRVLDLAATGMPMGMDVMGATRTTALTTLDQRLSVADVDTGAGTSIPMPDVDLGFWVTADNRHAYYLVAQAGKGDNGVDKNGLSAVHVLDEDLALVATLRRFNLYNTPLVPWVNQLQVDPRARTGYFVGPLQEQLAVFRY